MYTISTATTLFNNLDAPMLVIFGASIVVLGILEGASLHLMNTHSTTFNTRQKQAQRHPGQGYF